MTTPEPPGDRSRIVRGEGVDLHVVEKGRAGPPIVFVHGYPDTHAVWLPVVDRLSDHFRCVLYDVRGAGASQAPVSPDGYRTSFLVSDLVAVIDATSPDQPVHLVAHDWGSLQAWEAVLMAGSDPRLVGRIATYTTISGPSLGHFGAWAAKSRRGGWRQRRDLLRQMRHSWYLLAFQVPRVPEIALRRLLRSSESARRRLGIRHAEPTLVQDAVNGLGLYRANMHRGVRARHSLHTDIPVQLIVPLKDPFLTPPVYDDLATFCSDLTRHEMDASHWVQQSRPDEIARLVSAYVLAHSPDPPQ